MFTRFRKKQLHEVFGVQHSLPKFTYVERERYDSKIKYHLNAEKHIVIHGASKQGKSCLRKQTFQPSDVIIIQCLPTKSVDDLISDIQSELGITIPKRESRTREVEGKGGVSFTTGNKKSGSEVGFEAGAGGKSSTSKESEIPGGYNYDYRVIKAGVEKQGKKIIFEDFHYLTESVRQEMSFHLKGFYESGIFAIVIGVWSEQNLLTY